MFEVCPPSFHMAGAMRQSHLDEKSSLSPCTQSVSLDSGGRKAKSLQALDDSYKPNTRAKYLAAQHFDSCDSG